MTLQLGFTNDPKALVPGKPEQFGPTIDGLNKIGNAMRRAGDGLSKLDTAEHWSGPAGDAFRERFDSRPELWTRYGQVLNDVAGALEPYRDALSEAQRKAAESIALYNRAQQQTDQARAAYEDDVAQRRYNVVTLGEIADIPPFADPAAGEKNRAQKILDDARAQLAKAADTWHYRIAELRDRLPEEPGWLARRGMDLVDGLSTMATQTFEILDGAASAVAGMAQMVRMVNPFDPYNITHPKEYAENLGTVASGIGHAVTHPVDTVKAMVQWDTWKDSPGRAIGNLLPDIVLGAATGGGGVAARGALGAAKNMVDDVLGTGTKAATRHADDVVEAPRPPAPQGPPPEWGPFGPRGSDVDAPSISDRMNPQTEPPPTRTHPEDWDYPQDPFRPGPDDYHDAPSHEQPPHHAEPPEPQRPEPMSRDELRDPDYQAGESDHAAYREQYGHQNGEARILDEIRARNPEAQRIPDEELLAIDRYMGADSQPINKSLWDDDPAGLAQHDPAIRNATSGMNRLDDYVGTVRRGIEVGSDNMAELIQRYEPGTEVRERGFTSTDTAHPYSGNVQFVIESHTGKDISWMRDPHGGQHEVAFPPHNKFYVESAGWNPITQKYEIKLIDRGK
ncbi:putative T7SS-secreted protein [Kibdelosporangium phytohabitans]|uniref:Putative T7SS secretion signal domain-containing protein n=1 Tax=Kibdelosporangium phytohabitans TaxID=860235 RepID=A0A0N7F551_9PSEU|nr:hypothetical protein [Kibdelosporangium phytohabitans]ALG13255.1 hypothetical protein AOZ06_46065 [Kibdelosporangium phytohabitans]MBE1465026.1 uncharacterized protein YukE [Kibdelosporangium phytohabitans]